MIIGRLSHLSFCGISTALGYVIVIEITDPKAHEGQRAERRRLRYLPAEKIPPKLNPILIY